MRQIEKEVVTLNWKKSKFHTLGEGGANLNPYQSDLITSTDIGEAPSRKMELSYTMDRVIDSSSDNEDCVELDLHSMEDETPITSDDAAIISTEAILSMKSSDISPPIISSDSSMISNDNSPPIISSDSSMISNDISPPIISSDAPTISNVKAILPITSSDSSMISSDISPVTISNDNTPPIISSDVPLLEYLSSAVTYLDDTAAHTAAQDIHINLSQDKIMQLLGYIRVFTVFSSEIKPGLGINISTILEDWKWTMQLMLKIFSNAKVRYHKDLSFL
jgi:hypothetical protein